MLIGRADAGMRETNWRGQAAAWQSGRSISVSSHRPIQGIFRRSGFPVEFKKGGYDFDPGIRHVDRLHGTEYSGEKGASNDPADPPHH